MNYYMKNLRTHISHILIMKNYKNLSVGVKKDHGNESQNFQNIQKRIHCKHKIDIY